MLTSELTVERLAASVWAVPPLARRADFSLNTDANRRLIKHIESGGITTLLYGGNAILYHVALSEYRQLLELIADAAADDTLVIPSVGPAFGTMIDQADILRDFDFPTAMVLPQPHIASPAGITSGIHCFAARFGKPVVLYIRSQIVEPADAGRLMQDGVLCAIKYAVPRDDPSDDDYLRALVDAAGPQRMLSGLGDQPAPVHMRTFGLNGFTTGCGCIAPRLCTNLLNAIRGGEDGRVSDILAKYRPLEHLRNKYGPITVLHAAVTLAGIADMGPVIPLLSPVDPAHHDAICRAALVLLETDAHQSRGSGARVSPEG